jgi:hypothetical protein
LCVHGKLNGKQIYWWSNTRESSEKNYVDGKRHGKCFTWASNGQLIEETYYFNDKLNGEQSGWYLNGNKRYIINYFNDKLHGKYEKWDEQGKLIKNEDYVMGYPKKRLLIILRTLRKTKWLRLAKLCRTKSFNEWWYAPDNPGGKITKKKLSQL